MIKTKIISSKHCQSQDDFEQLINNFYELIQEDEHVSTEILFTGNEYTCFITYYTDDKK